MGAGAELSISHWRLPTQLGLRSGDHTADHVNQGGIRVRLVLLVTALVVTLALAQPAMGQDSGRTISVVGETTMTVPNDAARFVAAASVRRQSSRAALRASSSRMRRVIARLVRAGVARQDIETLAVSVRRVRVRRRGPLRYLARNSAGVQVRVANRAGELMDLAVRAGATSVGELDFFRSDARAVYRRALVSALEDARLKAAELARASGLTLGRVRSIRESGFESSVTDHGGAQGRVAPQAAPPVAPGTSTVEGRVFVVFEAT